MIVSLRVEVVHIDLPEALEQDRTIREIIEPRFEQENEIKGIVALTKRVDLSCAYLWMNEWIKHVI